MLHVHTDVADPAGERDGPFNVPTPDPFLLALGAAIRTRRERLGLTQEALAREVGTSQKRIYEWEHGLRDIQVGSSLLPLARALRMSVVALLAAADVEMADRELLTATS